MCFKNLLLWGVRVCLARCVYFRNIPSDANLPARSRRDVLVPGAGLAARCMAVATTEEFELFAHLIDATATPAISNSVHHNHDRRLMVGLPGLPCVCQSASAITSEAALTPYCQSFHTGNRQWYQ